MITTSINTLWGAVNGLKTFFVPSKISFTSKDVYPTVSKAILLPTYNPTSETYNIVSTISKWYPEILIVVIDDSTPLTNKTSRIINKVKDLASKNANVVYQRTPINSLKAGALNFGINYLVKLSTRPQVVFVFDDDITINKKTLPLLTKALYSDKKIGAVCSVALVRNKNQNLITRLQSLEYHNFAISKIADNQLFMGPLVMQGMLTAFRTQALLSVKGYAEKHLIEDYDITARLKTRGWKVKIEPAAEAWTKVPHTLEGLWRQRVRWTLGGLSVVTNFWKFVPAVFQDLLGHVLFLSMLGLIAISFLVEDPGVDNSQRIFVLLTITFFTFVLGFIFSLFTLLSYPKSDKRDWLIKISILPEFIYSNILSLILIGSYVFFAYTRAGKFLLTKIKYVSAPYQWGLFIFEKLGYSNLWGTRS